MLQIKKFAAGVASAGLLLGSAATSVLAQSIDITDNGQDSTNTATIKQKCINNVSQSNYTYVSTSAQVSANSGLNTANNNNTGGGNVLIDTGPATASATVTVGGGSNTANLPDCCICDGNSDPAIVIDHNAQGSTNNATIKGKQKNLVTQKNKTKVRTRARVRANSGLNDASGNNTPGGGDVEIFTDPAASSVGVNVTPPSNSIP